MFGLMIDSVNIMVGRSVINTCLPCAHAQRVKQSVCLSSSRKSPDLEF